MFETLQKCDRDRIAYYSPEAANRLLDKILDKFETLARFPNLGKSRDELVVGLLLQ